MQEGELLRQVRDSADRQEPGTARWAWRSRADQDPPDLADDFGQEVRGCAVVGDDPFPVPLIDIAAVVVVEEVVLAHGAHVGADALAGLAAELLQRDPLPFGRGLHDLRIDWVHVAVVADVELHGSARAIPVEHVVDAAVAVDDERHRDHHEVQLAAEVFLDVLLDREDRPLRFPRRQQGVVVPRQHLLEIGVTADARSGEIGSACRP